MDINEYSVLIKRLTEHRHGLSDSKRKDYTKGSDDVLANFKNVAESTGLRPEQVLLVYMQKQFDAVANYVKSNGQSESEPIKERISDLLNYGELLWGLINEVGDTGWCLAPNDDEMVFNDKDYTVHEPTDVIKDWEQRQLELFNECEGCRE